MREILFSGKGKRGGWVQGHLTTWRNRDGTIEYQIKDGHENCCVVTTVIPETVGQFTGRTDKKGKKVFEGDKVIAEHTNYYNDEYEKEPEYEPYEGIVIYEDCAFAIKQRDKKNYNPHLCNVRITSIEVVGNIHGKEEQDDTV